MHIVAIHNMIGDKENLAKSLASVLGVTVYETRPRLNVPGGGPSVVASFADLRQAEETAQKLRAAGLTAVVLAPDAMESDASRFAVRRFELTDQGIRAESRQGKSPEVLFRDADLILRGTSIVRQTETETIGKRKLDIGRAVMTSGLSITKTEKSTRETTTESREGFFHLYSKGGPVLVFREFEVLYESLGPAMQPSRAANFIYILNELRRRCPHARYDDRLVNRSGQAQLLGPLLSPEEHLDIAISLLATILFT
ncbi:MAG: hypothetical protein AABY87_12155 [bacterium]